MQTCLVLICAFFWILFNIHLGTPLLTSKWFPSWYNWDGSHLTGLQLQVHTWNEGTGSTRTSVHMHDAYEWQVTIYKCHIWLRHEVDLWFWNHMRSKLLTLLWSIGNTKASINSGIAASTYFDVQKDLWNLWKSLHKNGMQRKAVPLSSKMQTTWIMHCIWDTKNENQNKYKEWDVFAGKLLHKMEMYRNIHNINQLA